MRIEELHEFFTRLLPEFEAIARAKFRHLGPETADEAVQNTICLAWKYWFRLAEKGLADREGLLWSVFWYSQKQTRVGRTITRGAGDRGRWRQDVYDFRQDGKVVHIDFNDYHDDLTPIPDQVAFRLDLPAFMATLTERQRAMASSLASGMTTKQAARQHGVSPAAVSQFRSRFKMLLERFHEGA